MLPKKIDGCCVFNKKGNGGPTFFVASYIPSNEKNCLWVVKEGCMCLSEGGVVQWCRTGTGEFIVYETCHIRKK